MRNRAARVPLLRPYGINRDGIIELSPIVDRMVHAAYDRRS